MKMVQANNAKKSLIYKKILISYGNLLLTKEAPKSLKKRQHFLKAAWVKKLFKKKKMRRKKMKIMICMSIKSVSHKKLKKLLKKTLHAHYVCFKYKNLSLSSNTSYRLDNMNFHLLSLFLTTLQIVLRQS